MSVSKGAESSGNSLDDSLTNIQWLCQLESNQILEGTRRKQKQTEARVPERVEPKNPHPKPPYSYASLIVFAINSVAEKKMTLQEIYNWIEQHYPFYKYAKKGWKNSIRHNLSLHRFFVKEKRPSSLTGKGSFWSISPDSKENVMREIMKQTSANAAPYTCQTPGGLRTAPTLRPLLPKPHPFGETAANTMNMMTQNKLVGNSPLYIPAGTPIVFVPTPMYVHSPHLKTSNGNVSQMPSPIVVMGGNPNASSTPLQTLKDSNHANRGIYTPHLQSSSQNRDVSGHSRIAILRKSVSRKTKPEGSFQEYDSGIDLSPKKPRMASAGCQADIPHKSTSATERAQPTLAEINTSKDYSGFSPEKYKDFINNLSFMSSPGRSDNAIVTPSKKGSMQNVQLSPSNWLSPLRSVFAGLTPTKSDMDSGIFTPLKDLRDLQDISFSSLTPFMSNNTPMKFFESPFVSKSTKKNSKGCRKALINDVKVEGDIFLKPLPGLCFNDGIESKL